MISSSINLLATFHLDSPTYRMTVKIVGNLVCIGTCLLETFITSSLFSSLRYSGLNTCYPSNNNALKIETKFLGCPKNLLDSMSIEFKMIPPSSLPNAKKKAILDANTRMVSFAYAYALHTLITKRINAYKSL